MLREQAEMVRGIQGTGGGGGGGRDNVHSIILLQRRLDLSKGDSGSHRYQSDTDCVFSLMIKREKRNAFCTQISV